MMEKTIIQKLLFDYFEGRTTSMQRKLIEDWLATDANNETVFYEYLNEWESQTPQYLPDENKGWAKFEALLNTPPVPLKQLEEVAITTPLKGRSRRYFWGIAAAIALLISLSFFVFQKTILYRIYETGYAQTQAINLPDGTLVTLNAHSKLYVPRFGFSGSKRTVLLEGEGDFNVAHTLDNKRFVIKTDTDFEVEVFGTQFVFYARDNAKKVVLNEGKVQINYQSGKQQMMKTGDIATLNEQSNELKLSIIDNPKKYTAWKEHQFYFDNTSFSDAALMIKERFGLQLNFTDSVAANRHLSGYFKAEKAEDLFLALSTLLNITIQQHNNTVSISSK
jgi:transmembrane sensor